MPPGESASFQALPGIPSLYSTASGTRNPGAGRLHAQPVDRGVPGDKHGLTLRPTPGTVRGVLGELDDANQRASGIEDPTAARTRAIDPALHVHFHAVRDAIRGIWRGHVGKVSTIGNGAVSVDIVDLDV